MTFAGPTELVRHVIESDGDDVPFIQNSISDRLDSDVCFKSWKKRRTPLKELRHFPKYRKDQYELYHSAARATALHKATQRQQELVLGLDSELALSKLIIPIGQVLFHGRADKEITESPSYPTYISTSLNAVVARNGAIRRVGSTYSSGKLTVYIFTTRARLKALWGQVGRSCEYEILLPRTLTCRKTAEYTIGDYQIVEADVYC